MAEERGDLRKVFHLRFCEAATPVVSYEVMALPDDDFPAEDSISLPFGRVLLGITQCCLVRTASPQQLRRLSRRSRRKVRRKSGSNTGDFGDFDGIGDLKLILR